MQEVLEAFLGLLVAIVEQTDGGEFFFIIIILLLLIFFFLRGGHARQHLLFLRLLVHGGLLRCQALFPILINHVVLLLDESLELALLEVANQDLALLAVIHLAKLPELVLLEDTKGPEI